MIITIETRAVMRNREDTRGRQGRVMARSRFLGGDNFGRTGLLDTPPPRLTTSQGVIFSRGVFENDLGGGKKTKQSCVCLNLPKSDRSEMAGVATRWSIMRTLRKATVGYFVASSSNLGAMVLQGPHHSPGHLLRTTQKLCSQNVKEFW